MSSRYFKNHINKPRRIATTTGQVILFGPNETRAIPESLTEQVIEAGLAPVEGSDDSGEKAETSKRSAAAKKAAETRKANAKAKAEAETDGK